MREEGTLSLQEDIIVTLLRSQIGSLSNVLHYIEEGNSVNGYVDETIKRVERELHWLRRDLLTND